MATFDDSDPYLNEEEPVQRRPTRRPVRRRMDVNELPVWTWVAILLVVVAVGGALWMMNRSSRQAASLQPTPTVAASPAAAGTPAPTGGATAAAAPAASTPTLAAPAAISVGARVVVNGTGTDKLRLRAGPGTGSETLDFLPDGTEFKVLEGPQSLDGYEWWRIEMSDGTIGWAVGQFLKPVN